jgi:hypothetical protein
MLIGFSIGLAELVTLCGLFYVVVIRPFIRWSDRQDAITEAAETEK